MKNRGSNACFFERLVDIFKLTPDGSFSLLLLGHVVEDKLEALEHVEQENENQASILHCCVLDVEQEHIEQEGVESGQWLQFLERGSLLSLECHESARLASHSKESSAERKHPRDPIEACNGRVPKTKCQADGEIQCQC